MTDPIKNPFLSRVMIRDPLLFFGREREIQFIFNRLNASPPQSVAVVGMRRIGKSSLLYHCTHPEVRKAHLDRPKDYLITYLDLQSVRGADAIGFFRRIGELAQAEAEDLSLPDINDQEGFLDLVRRLETLKHRWVILLDEFEILTCNPDFGPEFFSFLRSAANRYDVAYVTATGVQLGKLCHSHEIADSPFFNIFTSLRLGPFSDETARELITTLSKRAGLEMEAHARTLMEKAGCLPMFLQMGCAAFVDCLIQGGRVTDPDWLEIQELFMEEARSHYQYLINNLSKPECEVLMRIAQGDKVREKSLSHVVRELDRNGFLEQKRGRPVIASEWFADFLFETEEQESAPPDPQETTGTSGEPVKGVPVSEVIRPQDDYDVFISYRRDQGAETARLIQLAMASKGLRVFLDVDEMRSGHFDEGLLYTIENTSNFIVVLSPGSLDRCSDPEDWLRREVEHAIKTDRNIVPIFMSGFRFPHPDDLPEHMRTLPKHNGVNYSHEYFDEMIRRVIKFL
jgi:hypothetical protein